MIVRFGMLALSLCLSTLAGCATGSGLHAVQTQVHLAERNYRVVATSVRGTSSSLRVFGIGSSPSFGDAMTELRSKALLLNEDGPPRALINLTEDSSTSLYVGPIVMFHKLVLTADVIEFIAPGEATVAESRAPR